jgi:hypothetical protein
MFRSIADEIGVLLIEGLPFYSCIIVLAFFLFMYYRLPLHVEQASPPLSLINRKSYYCLLPNNNI